MNNGDLFLQRKIGNKISIGSLLTVLVLSVSVSSVYAVGVSLGGIPQDIGNGIGVSPASQIASSGDNVFAVWRNGLGIFYSTSSNSGSSFSPETEIGTIPATTPEYAPQIAAFNNVGYAVWTEVSSGEGDVKFGSSSDDFAALVILSSSTIANSVSPQIATSGNNVYAVWHTKSSSSDGLISFKSGGSQGSDFNSNGVVDIGSTDRFDPKPQMATSGNVYVVWQTNANIKFAASTNGGGVFSAPITVGNTGSDSSPQVAASNGLVYVAWQQGGDIKFARSTNNGVSFSAPSNIGNAGASASPQMAAEGNNVYVVWHENSAGIGDILFRASTDNGVSLENNPATPPVNLSQNGASSSINPQITALGDNVYVVWKDNGLDPNFDILLRVSDDRGASFSSVQEVTENNGFSTNPQVSVSGDSIFVIWNDDGSGPPGDAFDILFRTASLSGPEISFDKNLYRDTESATITVVDSTSAGTIDVTVKSTKYPQGIVLELNEDSGNLGTFTGTVIFTPGTSSGTSLQVEGGDTITASFGGNNGLASIYPKMAEFFDGGVTLLDVEAIVHPEVIDQNSNLNPNVKESVTVDIKTTADPVGIQLVLPETGPNTGIFGGDPLSNLIFLDGEDLVTTNSIMTISQVDEDANENPNAIDTTTVKVSSTSDPIGFTLTLQETGNDEGDFSGVLELNPTVSVPPPFITPSLKASDGDIITIKHLLGTYRTMVTQTNPSANGAIKVALAPDFPGDTFSDEVTLSFNPSFSAKVSDAKAPGGGGGGLVRPGLVVNALAGAKTFLGGGGGGGNSPPLFGTSSFAIIDGGQEGFGGILSDNDAKTLEETKTFKVGQKASLRFDYTEGGGIGNIEHIGLYTNVRDGQMRQDSDAYIYYDPLKSPKLTVHDPNGRFSEVNFDLLQKDATHFALKFDVIFAKPMATSDLILESWNLKKWSTIDKIPNAIEVTSSGILQETASAPKVETFLEDVTDAQVIPVWVKSNAKWWSDGKIDNDNFISGIEYLVNEGIIKVSLPETTDNASIPEVQPWIKNTAGWWADGMISEDEFITAIEWLISNNIIQVAA